MKFIMIRILLLSCLLVVAMYPDQASAASMWNPYKCLDKCLWKYDHCYYFCGYLSRNDCEKLCDEGLENCVLKCPIF